MLKDFMKFSHFLIRNEDEIHFNSQYDLWRNEHSDETGKYMSMDEEYFIHQEQSTPCLNVLKEAYGIYLEDIEGRKYMDFHGNNMHLLGYRNPRIIQAIKNTIDKLSFCPGKYTNIYAIELARKLIALSPKKLNKVIFAPGGLEVNSMALKLARIITGRRRIITMWDSYHGATLDNICLGREPIFCRDWNTLLTGVEHVPGFNRYRGFLNDHPRGEMIYADYIEYILEKEDDIGALMAETIRNTDVQIPSKNFWKRIRELCDHYNVLLILDEIPIGLGRTGKFFAFENFDIVPDIVTVGKGLGGEIFPFAVLFTRDEFKMGPLPSESYFTLEKSPLGAVAALETIDYIEKEKILSHVSKLEGYIRGRFLHMRGKYEIIGDVRGIGLLWGVELVKDRKTKDKAEEITESIMFNCLRRGLNLKITQGNIINFTPPLIISERELDNAFEILENAIYEVNSLNQQQP